MTKCDFCTQSAPNGKCFWSSQSMRKNYCEEAIDKMTEAFKSVPYKAVIERDRNSDRYE